ncbi:MAG: Ger(x)C family spore germination protein [Eubacteriales bacterium]
MKKWFLVLCYTLVILIFSGCWSNTEPKELEISESVLYDITDSGKYKITVEVKDTTLQTQGSSEGESINITSGEGDTIPEAIRDRSKNMEKRLFGAQNKVRFYSDEFYRVADLSSVLDSTARDNLTYETPFMVIIKSKDPDLLYTADTGLSGSVGEYIDNLSKTQQEYSAGSVFVTTLDVIKDYYSEGIQPVMGVVEIVADDEDTQKLSTNLSQAAQSSSSSKFKIKYEGLAAFKDEKLVGYLDKLETASFNMLTNNIKSTYTSTLVEDNVVSLKLQNCKSDIKTSIKNGEVTIDLTIDVDLNIAGVSGTLDVNEKAAIKKVEQNFNKQTEIELMSVINKAQDEFSSDIFGFGNYVHSQHPEKWKEIKANWDDCFSKAKVNIEITSSVIHLGEIKGTMSTED